jgi:exosortase/archaeosortase family protein
MSTNITQAQNDGAGPRLPILRWVFLGLLVRFDTGSLTAQEAWWSSLLGHAPFLPRVAIVAVLATALFGGRALLEECRALSAAAAHSSGWLYLLAHLGAFAGFTAFTWLMLEGSGAAAYGGLWFVCWLLFGGLAALTLVAAAFPGGRGLMLLRRCAGPLLAGFGVAVAGTVAGQLTQRLWRLFAGSTLPVVAALLRAAGVQVTYEPGRLEFGTTTFFEHMGPPCSGYDGLGLIWVFVGASLWWFRHELRFPAALLVLLPTTLVFWLWNVVRIAALFLIGTWVSRDLAIGGFHSPLGWLSFNAIALGTVWLVRRSRAWQLVATP